MFNCAIFYGLRFTPKCSFEKNLRFAQHDLALKIPITWVPMPAKLKDGSQEFPVLQATDTVSFLAETDNLPKLFGEAPMDGIKDTLLEFWRRFATTNGDHQVFEAAAKGLVCLERAIPILLHGDEGRGFKRQGVMCLSLQGAIGKGTRPFQDRFQNESSQKARMGVNMAGSSFNTRLLFASMPKKWYNTNPDS